MIRDLLDILATFVLVAVAIAAIIGIVLLAWGWAVMRGAG